MRICVYGAASPTIDPEYKEKVEQMGKEMSRADIRSCLAVAGTA